ncbi:MAG TPA: NADPH:quinone reductase [Vicinamibacterales bacterium]|nr:NADPH:quinone reductase [Vicinamibacterales bacterium]
MLAIVARAFGGPEVLILEEPPDPVPGPDEVLVRVHAAGVNPYDTYMRAGGYAIAPGLPYVPGADAAGVVEQVGETVTGVRAGDRVYIGGTAAGRAHGAYASLVVCRATQIHPLPERLSFAQGAAINVPYVTAWRALFHRAQAESGETVLVHGASGAVGLAVTQLARAAGHTVIGTAGTPDGAELVRAQGADHVLNHREAGYLDQLGSITSGGPDVIVEMLANQNLDLDLTVLARQGRVVVVGNRGRVEIDPRKAMAKDAAILGMSLWSISEDDLARIHDGLGRGFADGSLTPVVGRELPLADAARAHQLILEPGARGKIVLIP